MGVWRGRVCGGQQWEQCYCGDVNTEVIVCNWRFQVQGQYGGVEVDAWVRCGGVCVGGVNLYLLVGVISVGVSAGRHCSYHRKHNC